MDLRLQHLAHLDPQAVPLPHGTEVTTGVDRVVGDRTVPQGAVGRVVKVSGDEVDVLLVGVGTVRYARRELTPRKVGQAQFAQRREAAWTSLRSCTVLETVVGSRAWGLSDEGSDTDLRGAFALPLGWSVGLVEGPADLVSADGSATYWRVDKAVRQAMRADPNTLEMLFVPGARALDPIGEWLLASRHALVSAEIHGSFGRYALSQLKRLEQSQRLAAHRDAVLSWLRDDPTLSLDAVSARLAAAFPRAMPSVADALHQSKQYVKQLCRSLHDQGLLASSEFSAMARFAHDDPSALELPRELRPKNAYNLLRLIVTATGWLRTGEPEFAMTGAFRERLLDIKQGRVPLSEVLAEAESLAPALEEARHGTRLPPHPDVAAADALLRRLGVEIARRAVHADEGPWGSAAPPPPEVVWIAG
jgi:hypothetical protein